MNGFLMTSLLVALAALITYYASRVFANPEGTTCLVACGLGGLTLVQGIGIAGALGVAGLLFSVAL